MKIKKLEILALVLIILVQSLIFVPFVMNKTYLHIEEARALGHASGDVAEIQDNENFYDTWHSGEYYNDYLTLDDGKGIDIVEVYKNQMGDTTPPLYFILLRCAMSIGGGELSFWYGAIINMIAYVFITVFLYLITRKLFVGEKHAQLKSVALTFLASITLGTLSNAIYTGMFSLVTLAVLILAYQHVKMYENGKATAPVLVGIGIVSFIGLITSYYCLLFIFPMYVLFLMRYIRGKDKKSLLAYSFTLLGATLAAIAVFPFAIYNMFFGNLGGEIVGTLGVQSALIRTLVDYVQKVNHFGFNNMLIVIAVLAVVCIVLKMRRPYVEKEENDEVNHKKMIVKTLLIPALVYCLGVVAVSQWTELRYIVPVCSIIFVLTMYGIYKFVAEAFSKKVCAIILSLLVVAMVVYPVISGSTPECTYEDKEEVLEEIKKDYNIPTVYLMNTDDDRFLDDIMLFMELDNSYIAKDFTFLDQKADFNAILDGQDVSGGFLLVINNGQANRHILEDVLTHTGFDGFKTLYVLNSGTVYYIGNGIEKEEIEDNYHDEMYESTMEEALSELIEE